MNHAEQTRSSIELELERGAVNRRLLRRTDVGPEKLYGMKFWRASAQLAIRQLAKKRRLLRLELDIEHHRLVHAELVRREFSAELDRAQATMLRLEHELEQARRTPL
jgi:hypothetical protein